jgi:ABC-type transporter Mla subunit MlaD
MSADENVVVTVGETLGSAAGKIVAGAQRTADSLSDEKAQLTRVAKKVRSDARATIKKTKKKAKKVAKSAKKAVASAKKAVASAKRSVKRAARRLKRR